MTDFIDDKIHYLNIDSDGIELPSEFTFPFHYTPHPLTVKAAHEVQNYIASRTDWTEELSAGKMFGVLIVQMKESAIWLHSPGILQAVTYTSFLYLPYMICYSQTVSSASKKQPFLQSTNRLRNWKIASN